MLLLLRATHACDHSEHSLTIETLTDAIETMHVAMRHNTSSIAEPMSKLEKVMRWSTRLVASCLRCCSKVMDDLTVARDQKKRDDHRQLRTYRRPLTPRLGGEARAKRGGRSFPVIGASALQNSVATSPEGAMILSMERPKFP